jgi:hypothetical protein
MTRKLVPGEKPLFWIGSSLKDITQFPSEVQRSVGFGLSAAQYGGKHPSENRGRVKGREFWRSSKTMTETRTGRSTPSASQMPSMFCTRFRRSHRMALRPGNPTLLWSKSV